MKLANGAFQVSDELLKRAFLARAHTPNKNFCIGENCVISNNVHNLLFSQNLVQIFFRVSSEYAANGHSSQDL